MVIVEVPVVEVHRKYPKSAEIPEREVEKFQKPIVERIDWGEDVAEQFERSHKRRMLVTEEALKWKESTNSDAILYLECLRFEFSEIKVTSSKEDVIFRFPKSIIKLLPSPETFTRCRRKLNQQGIGLPTDENVIIMRSLREKAIKSYFSPQQL